MTVENAMRKKNAIIPRKMFKRRKEAPALVDFERRRVKGKIKAALNRK